MTAPVMRHSDKIWVAGVYSVTGELKVRKHNGKYELQLTFMSTKRPGVLDKLALHTGCSVRRHPGNKQDEYMMVRLSGGAVTRLTETVWRWLDGGRRREYETKMAIARRRNEELAIQEARARESIGLAQIMDDPTRRRERAELLYDNSDPAVIVIHDSLDTSWADEMEIAREKAARDMERARAQARLANPLGQHDNNKRRKRA